jgi:hypothetical protein
VETVEDVISSLIRGSGIGNIGGDIRDRYFGANNHAACASKLACSKTRAVAIANDKASDVASLFAVCSI